MPTTSALGSPWLAALDDVALRPALGRRLETDVCIVGGGITGATLALLLAREGMRVVLLEAARLGSGVTGTTTAKITALHGSAYSELRDKVGGERTAAYAHANDAALARVRELAGTIACEWEVRDAVTYTSDPAHVSDIEQEHSAASAAGLAVELSDHVDGPMPAVAAVVLRDQGQLQPTRYVLGLVEEAERAGAVVFEHSRVLGVTDGRPCSVRTEHGEVRAASVVIATHVPILDRGGFFARMTPMRSYAVGVRVAEKRRLPMAYSIDEPSRSVRDARDAAGEPLVVVGGEGHVSGRDLGDGRYDALTRTAAEWFGDGEVLHRWSAQDPVSHDGLPYAGRLWPGSSRLLVATGYRKWGLTNGTAAAMLLAERLLGREEPAWATAFGVMRRPGMRSALEFAKANAEVGWRFTADRVRSDHGVPDAAALAAGEGAVVGAPHRRRAVFRDDDGGLREHSAICTHLGCEVRFNAAEQSFDCPCHGSRFDARSGAVLEGPAVKALGD